MDRKDVLAMMAIMQTAYPRFYAQQGQEQMRAAVALWTEALAEYPVEAVRVALMRLVKESPYPPAIADVAQRVEAMRNIGVDDGEALWAKLAEAVCDGYYHAEERFAALPYACQRFVGTPGELRAMSQMDEDTLRTVTRGQFMRRVEALKEQERIMLETPRRVLDLLGVATDRMQLPEGEGRLAQ